MFDSKRHLSADFYRETFETAFQADNREQRSMKKKREACILIGDTQMQKQL